VSRPVVVTPPAREDQLSQAAFYDEVAGRQVGDRFIDSCERLFALIGEFPQMAPAVQWIIDATEDVRVCPVLGFRRILVFYKAETERVEILRVLHGARDIEGLSEQLGLQ